MADATETNANPTSHMPYTQAARSVRGRHFSLTVEPHCLKGKSRGSGFEFEIMGNSKLLSSNKQRPTAFHFAQPVENNSYFYKIFTAEYKEKQKCDSLFLLIELPFGIFPGQKLC